MFTQNDVIYSYTRKQAIEDGQQVKLTGEQARMARELYKYPVYLTSWVVSLINQAVSSKRHCNDFDGVLWDILWISRRVARQVSPTTYEFQTIITGAGRRKYHTFYIECGPTDIDNPAPALTIMLPEER